jgi:hypothetical protein
VLLQAIGSFKDKPNYKQLEAIIQSARDAKLEIFSIARKASSLDREAVSDVTLSFMPFTLHSQTLVANSLINTFGILPPYCCWLDLVQEGLGHVLCHGVLCCAALCYAVKSATVKGFHAMLYPYQAVKSVTAALCITMLLWCAVPHLTMLCWGMRCNMNE